MALAVAQQNDLLLRESALDEVGFRTRLESKAGVRRKKPLNSAFCVQQNPSHLSCEQ